MFSPDKLSDLPGLSRCPSCDVEPGKPHHHGCDVERCSVCGAQRAGCDHGECKGHDPLFARWTGMWPGESEALALGIVLRPINDDGEPVPDLNRFYVDGYYKAFFIKPTP